MPSDPALSLPDLTPRGQRSSACSFRWDVLLEGVECGLAAPQLLSSILGQLRGKADLRKPWACAGALTCGENHALSVQQSLKNAV